ncbi:STAS domain-containing protein [Streptacidiphilus sp. PAMC 29251]
MDADIDQEPEAVGALCRVVTACGELDVATTAVLRMDLNRRGSPGGVRRLVVDLSAVTFMDASALGSCAQPATAPTVRAAGCAWSTPGTRSARCCWPPA